MKRLKLLLSAALMLFCASVQAETITEGFEDVSIVDANGNAVTGNYTAGAGLSNGWIVVDGGICKAADYSNFGLWTTAYSGSVSLTSQYGSSNSAVIVIPAQLTGKISFYTRKTSSSSSTKGYIDIFEMEKDGDTFKKKSSTSLKYWTLTSTTWDKYEYDLGTTARYIGISIVRAAIDDVVYNTVSTEPHEHSYATTWSSDETGHWHACTSETGYCNTPKADFAAHDGAICSVCGYKAPGIESFPWTEDFNSITSGIPTGWDNSEGTTTDSYKWTSTSGGHDGKCVRFDSYNNGSDKTNILATPLLYIPESGKFQLKFWCKNPKGGNYSVQIGEYGSTERTTVLDNLTNIANWTEQTVDLSAYAGKAIKVYFCGTSNWGSGDAYLYLDDVTVKELIAHTHDYATDWSTDRTNHWHVCLSEVGDCDVPVSDLAAHSFDENDVCTVCGYEKGYEIDFTSAKIPAEWTNNGWKEDGDHLSSGNYDTNILTTSYLKAKAGNVLEVEAYLRYTDEPLVMEYSADCGDTWTQAFSVVADADHYSGGEIKILTFTAPADGEYQFRFWGQYTGLKSICGFKDAYKKDIIESSLKITAANQWGTLCYPNEVEVPEGAQAYTATDVVDGVIELAEVEGTIPANTPVLVYAEKGATLTLPAVKHVTSLAEPVKADGNLFVGCTGAFTLNQNNQYVLQKQNDEVAFYRVNPEKPITTVAYRCYLETVSTESGAKIGISFDDATGISEVKTENSNSIYDLSGRKVEKMQKGVIYIINNHKVIVK